MNDCHYLKRIKAGDEIHYRCELNESNCIVEYQDKECENQEEE